MVRTNSNAWWEIYCLEHGIQPDGKMKYAAKNFDILFEKKQVSREILNFEPTLKKPSDNSLNSLIAQTVSLIDEYMACSMMYRFVST